MTLLLFITLRIAVNIVFLTTLCLVAYLRFWQCMGTVKKVLLMGVFNKKEEDWAQFLAISDEKFSETWNSSYANNFGQPVTKPTQKDEDILNLMFIKYDDPEILRIEKHPNFPTIFLKF